MFGFARKAYLDYDAEKRIVAAIGKAESNTRAEIRVHLAAKIKKDVYTDAVANFKRLGLFKTELRNAVMIYVVPSAKEFAIVGDVGIHEKVRDEFWNEVRDSMAKGFQRNMGDGIVKGVEMAGAKLEEYFPLTNGASNPDELSNEISRG